MQGGGCSREVKRVRGGRASELRALSWPCVGAVLAVSAQPSETRGWRHCWEQWCWSSTHAAPELGVLEVSDSFKTQNSVGKG